MESKSKKYNFSVLIYNIQSKHNVKSIINTALSFDCDKNIRMVALFPFHSEFLPKILSQMKISWVHSFAAGVEGLFRLREIKESSIVISNSKGAYSESFGEIGVLGMMYFSYSVGEYVEKMMGREWWRGGANELIRHRTVLIIGYGHNGVSFAKKCKCGFEMKVIGVVRKVRKEVEGREYADEIWDMEELMNENKNLKEVDFVYATLPETKETVNIFNLAFFKRLKTSAVFMNIGRGTAVVEDDLCYALENNLIKGVFLDVTQDEPIKKDSKLYSFSPKKLLLSNHSMGVIKNFYEYTIDCLCENIRYFLEKGVPKNLVNKENEY